MAVEISFAQYDREQRDRKRRAADIAVVDEGEGQFTVRNTRNGHVYDVVFLNGGWGCGCVDHQRRNDDCKHILAVKTYMAAMTGTDHD